MTGNTTELATRARAIAAAKNLHALLHLVTNDPFLERTIHAATNVVEKAGLLDDCSMTELLAHETPTTHRFRYH